MGKKILVKKIKTTKKNEEYIYPTELIQSYNVELYFSLPPNSKNWVHDTQFDDVMNDDTMRRTKQIRALKKIISPEQRTKEWYEQRDGMMTASLIPTALGLNEYEKQYRAIVHKLIEIPFTGKKTCFWGKKFEPVATAIYQYRMNVIVDLYGCIPHDCKFIGASPDGIISEYKLDGIHKTNLVGRMLEVKCVVTRKINMTSNNIHEIIPEHYYPQPQIQMQCCKLDDCDFWQCNIKEYNSREDFINDTNAKEPFRSKTTGFEKGVLIQLLPISVINGKTDSELDEIRYDHAQWIYPPRIDMTPHDCDMWVSQTCSNYQKCPEWKNYMLDKVIYWKLHESRCVTTKRDDKWFKEKFPILEKIWNYVKFFRHNKEMKELFLKYVKYAETTLNDDIVNDKIMNVAEILSDTSNKKYNHNVKKIKKELIDIDEHHDSDDVVENKHFTQKYSNSKSKKSNAVFDFNQVLIDI
jgi:putative phage-type endonuclease